MRAEELLHKIKSARGRMMGIGLLLEFERAIVDRERERAARCVERARFGEADTDLRSIISAIRSGVDPDAE